MGRFARKAALDWGISRATLRHCIDVIQPRSIAFCHLQRLSKVQEDPDILRLSDLGENLG